MFAHLALAVTHISVFSCSSAVKLSSQTHYVNTDATGGCQRKRNIDIFDRTCLKKLNISAVPSVGVCNCVCLTLGARV